jgi:serine/threonine-protein kinase
MSTMELTHLGRYRLLEELGRGAMGIVFRAEDPSLGRIVALKAVQLTSEAAASLDYEARFNQEAKAAGSLNHRGIITIFDTGREGTWAYIAMEMLQGAELRELLLQGRMPVARALDIAAQVADALEVAHEHGVVHRDIKPGNIMVMAGDHAKIMDFGIARMRVSEVETQVGLVLGSPKYMSPEQVAGRRVDHRSDIFSLGVVLFEMLGGMAPFSGKDMGELMFAVTHTQQPRPSQLNPHVPPMLDLIVEKALQKDAATRYQSAREMADDLRLCRDALPDDEKLARPMGESTVPLNLDTTVPNQLDHGGSTTTQSLVEGATAPAPLPANAAVPDQTTQRVPTINDVWFSRRFNSAKALQRLAEPSQQDLIDLANVPMHAHRTSLLSGNAAQMLLLVIAVLIAIAIAAS